LWKDVGEGRFDRLSDCKCGDYKLDGWMFGNSWLSDREQKLKLMMIK